MNEELAFIPRPVKVPALGLSPADGIPLDRVELKCANCGAKYYGDTARVQRAMKQVIGADNGAPMSRAKTERITPKLCWVCTRLFVSAHQLDMQDLMCRHLSTGDE